jgi:hypothetical protein
MLQSSSQIPACGDDTRIVGRKRLLTSQQDRFLQLASPREIALLPHHTRKVALIAQQIGVVERKCLSSTRDDRLE